MHNVHSNQNAFASTSDAAQDAGPELITTRLLDSGAIQIELFDQFRLVLGGNGDLFELCHPGHGDNSENQRQCRSDVRGSLLGKGQLFWTGARMLRALSTVAPSNAGCAASGSLATRRRCRDCADHLNTLIRAFAPKRLLQIYTQDHDTVCADIATFWRDIATWDKAFKGKLQHWRLMAPVLARMGFPPPPQKQVESLMQGLQEEIQSAGIISRGTFQALSAIADLSPFVRGGQINKRLLQVLDGVVEARGRKSAAKLFNALTPECLAAIDRAMDKSRIFGWLTDSLHRKVATQFWTMALEALMKSVLFNQDYDSSLAVDLHDLVDHLVPGSTLVPIVDAEGWLAKTLTVDQYLWDADFYARNASFDTLYSRALAWLESTQKVEPGLITGWRVPVPATEINGIVLEPIETVVDLLIEARRQGNCLARYGRKAATGHAFLYRMQSVRGSLGVESATVEFCRSSESNGRVVISEIRGSGNKEVAPGLIDVAQKFAEMIEQSLRCASTSKEAQNAS